MIAIDTVLVKDIPESLHESIGRTIGNYTIAFLRLHDGHQADLLGSGVLVSAGGNRAILTADHVTEVLPKTGRIGVFLDRTSHPHSIDAGGISIVPIGRGKDASSGPDLSVIRLAPQIAGSLAAKKLFFNLDRQQAEPLPLDFGVWFSQGFLQERTVVLADPTEEGYTKYFYNFSGIGRPDEIKTVGEFDYLDFPVEHSARPQVPERWNGMSGSGIWQVVLRKPEGILTADAPVLSGITFYQYPTTDTVCGIKAHARQSIYDQAARAIRNR